VLLLALALVALIAAWGWREWRWSQQLGAVRALLADWPGLHVERVASRAHHAVTVRGLIDPLADSPLAAIEARLPEGVEVALATRGYISTEPELVLRRARATLDLPDGVEVAIDGAVLVLEGRVPAERAGELVRLARLVPGVAAVEAGGLVAVAEPGRAELDALLAELARLELGFAPGADSRAADAELAAMAEALRRAGELAGKLGYVLAASSYGLTDEVGGEAFNAELRDARARWLARTLSEATGFEVGVLSLAEGDARATLKRRGARLALTLEPRPAP
jgi:hypothetical protein